MGPGNPAALWAGARNPGAPSPTERALLAPLLTYADPMDGHQIGLAHESRGAERCRARSKQSTKQCRLPAIPGGTVCIRHGGAAPQVAAAARRRLLDAFARRCLWQMRVAPKPDEK